MSWRDLLSPGPQTFRAPWLGGRELHWAGRHWRIRGHYPHLHGWYTFASSGDRHVQLQGRGEAEPDLEATTGLRCHSGYLVEDRLVPDTARVVPDPAALLAQTRRVRLVPRGLERFARARCGWHPGWPPEQVLFLQPLFPLGPEPAVQAAYEDRLDSLNHVAGVAPALDLAFRWQSLQRAREEAWRAEQARLQALEEARLEQEARHLEALRQAGTALGRRALAVTDFNAAARHALAISGARFLDAREVARGEMEVRYELEGERFGCIVNRRTLQVIQAGICLTDEYTGERGDTRFTLESLPPVVLMVMRSHRLVRRIHV